MNSICKKSSLYKSVTCDICVVKNVDFHEFYYIITYDDIEGTNFK